MRRKNWASGKTSFDNQPIPQNLRDALGTLEPVVTVKGLTITIADRTFPAQTVIVANAAVFRYFGLDNKAAAIIGPALLRYNSLAIDFNKRRVYIGPTSKATPGRRTVLATHISAAAAPAPRRNRIWFPATAGMTAAFAPSRPARKPRPSPAIALPTRRGR